MRRCYPRHYEDAAHIAHFLMRHGLRLKEWHSTHVLLLFVCCEMEISLDRSLSHSEVGRALVRILSDEPMEEARRTRLEAMAGTLFGNFVTSCQMSQGP